MQFRITNENFVQQYSHLLDHVLNFVKFQACGFCKHRSNCRWWNGLVAGARVDDLEETSQCFRPQGRVFRLEREPVDASRGGL